MNDCKDLELRLVCLPDSVKSVITPMWKLLVVTFNCNSMDFGIYYLTHETKEAIDEAKELYSVDELISNLTKDEIIHIREGY